MICLTDIQSRVKKKCNIPLIDQYQHYLNVWFACTATFTSKISKRFFNIKKYVAVVHLILWPFSDLHMGGIKEVLKICIIHCNLYISSV